MAVIGSEVVVMDRSGAQWVKCVRLVGNKDRLRAGNRAVVVVKKARPARRRKKTVQSGEIHLALVVKSSGTSLRKTGYSVYFPNTGVILIRKSDFSPLSNRIVGSVSQDLRFNTSTLKVLSMAYDAF